MNKFRWLSPLLDAEGEIGAASEDVEVTTEVVDPGSEEEVTPQAESESSFARRLREHSEKEVKNARDTWEKENSEKYKDYDLHKKMSEYLSELNGGVDAMTLMERRELEQLEERAERENVSPETLKRIDELEAKAAKGDKLEQDQQENQRVTTYFSTMDKFLEGKGVESKDLNQFMVENKLQYDPENMEKSFDIAYKAMKSEEFEKKANEKEADTIKRYLASKNGPKVEGSTGAAAAQTVDTSKMSWDQLAKHSAERVKASNTPQ